MVNNFLNCNLIDKIYYGWVNPKSLSEERSTLFDIYSRDNDLERQNEIANKADLRFKKSRQGISKLYIKKAKNLVANMIEHPDYRGWTSDSQKTLLKQFSSFKPKQTFFESREGKKLKNHDKVVHAIDKLKKIRNRGVHTENVKREIMKKNGQKREEFFEMDEDELNQIISKKKLDGTINNNPYRGKFFIETVPSAKPKFNKKKGKRKSVFETFNSNNDFGMVAFADNNEGLISRQKKIWNSKRMKYVGVTIDSMGQNLDHKREREREYMRKTGKLKKKFGIWKRTNKIELKKEGEEEDTGFTSQMRNRFRNRKRQNFRVDNNRKFKGDFDKKNKFRNSKSKGKQRYQTPSRKKNKINKKRKKF
jgi:hypothetical protein